MRRGLIEKLALPLLLLRPYRCERCDARFLALAISVRGKGSVRRETQPIVTAEVGRSGQEQISQPNTKPLGGSDSSSSPENLKG